MSACHHTVKQFACVFRLKKQNSLCVVACILYYMKMKYAFSLVELSIVLVILGLLTGGILAGQSLIRASELRTLTVEYQRYSAAFNTFRDKYTANPGDFRDATRFWARQATNAWCVSNSGLAVAGTPGTCDGNGNGVASAAGAASQSGEEFQIWRQLALAGLIEGDYTGLAGANGYDHLLAGTNVPASRLGNAIWRIYYMGDGSTMVGGFLVQYNNMMLGGANTAQNPLLRPEELWNIDTKLDDGKPGAGNIIARGYNTCANGTSNTDYAATYALTTTTATCTMIIPRIF